MVDSSMRRRQFLYSFGSTAATITLAGCPKQIQNNPDPGVLINEIWLFNADEADIHTFYVRLFDDENVVLDDQFRIEPKQGVIAGEKKIDERLPSSSGKYTLKSWLETNENRKSQKILHKNYDRCVSVDISVTPDRDYPAIFAYEDCNQ